MLVVVDLSFLTVFVYFRKIVVFNRITYVSSFELLNLFHFCSYQRMLVKH